MQPQLSGAHQKAYDRVFQHPMPHNLRWREVWSMLGAIGDAQNQLLAKGREIFATK